MGKEENSTERHVEAALEKNQEPALVSPPEMDPQAVYSDNGKSEARAERQLSSEEGQVSDHVQEHEITEVDDKRDVPQVIAESDPQRYDFQETDEIVGEQTIMDEETPVAHR